MFKAVIFSKVHNREFKSTFMSEDLANKWVDEHTLVQKLDPKEYSAQVFEIDSTGNAIPKPIEDPMELLRASRNAILCATDWLMLPDVKLDQKHRRLYVTYRQYLRDCPKGNLSYKIEDFAHWLRRNYPEEFMDGGDHKEIIARFKTYIKESK
jgi:hypothetical protein